MKNMNINKFKTLIIFLSVVMISVLMSNVFADGDNKKIVVKRFSATVSKPSGLILPDEMKKLQFKFSNAELSAWVRQNGEWYIEGSISHNNFFCADYSLGIRVGEGHPGCIDVKWLTEDQYATRKKQCNNVNMNHSGYQSNSEIAGIFGKITCAQAVVKCEGACQ